MFVLYEYPVVVEDESNGTGSVYSATYYLEDGRRVGVEEREGHSVTFGGTVEANAG